MCGPGQEDLAPGQARLRLSSAHEDEDEPSHGGSWELLTLNIVLPVQARVAAVLTAASLHRSEAL